MAGGGDGGEGAESPKYHLVRLDERRLPRKLAALPLRLRTQAPLQMPKPIADLMCDLLNPDMLVRSFAHSGADERRLAFGRVTEQCVKDASALLQRIYPLAAELREAVKSPKDIDIAEFQEKSRLVSDLSSQYYQLVPQSGFQFEAIKPLVDADELDEQQTLITRLSQLQSTCQTLLAAAHRRRTVHPFDYAYMVTACGVCPMAESDQVSQLILRYMRTVPKCHVTGIYELCRLDDLNGVGHRPQLSSSAAASDVGGVGAGVGVGNGDSVGGGCSRKLLLWHGTQGGNVASILAHGLLLAPPSASRVGRVFGRGLYFADAFAKCRGYCRDVDADGEGDGDGDGRRRLDFGRRRRPLFALLAEVELADCRRRWSGALRRRRRGDGDEEDEDDDDDEEEEELADNSDDDAAECPAKVVVGRRSPSGSGDVVLLPSGATLPLGDLAPTPAPPGYELLRHRMPEFNEFVVADEGRVRVRYLVRFDDNEEAARDARRQLEEFVDPLAAAGDDGEDEDDEKEEEEEEEDGDDDDDDGEEEEDSDDGDEEEEEEEGDGDEEDDEEAEEE